MPHAVWLRRSTVRCTFVATILICAATCVPARAANPPAPCTQSIAGGEWATYGEDYHGTQHQLAENEINTHNVNTLSRVWSIGNVAQNTGYQSAPPIVGGGCVFINTKGHIEALSLATGNLVWTSQGADTSNTFAVMVAGGRVHVGLYNAGKPEAAAFDVHSGHLLWISKPIYFGYPANQEASAIVYKGMQVLFTTGPDFDPNSRAGYGLIDAATGRVIFASTTTPQAELDQGYDGGGVWGTPTIDPQTNYLYVGTANPNSKIKESQYDNAIIKLDLDRHRPTFGHIVATYKGSSDSVTGYDNPVCQTVGGTLWVNGQIYGGSPTCGQTDVDFGVGPTLWRNQAGRLMGAALQKSGWLYVFYADTMTRAWDRQLFVTTGPLSGDLTRIAADGGTLYLAANPGILYAFNAQDGALRWRTPLTGLPMKGGNVALANGITYYVDEPALKAFDATTGQLLWMSSPTPAASIGSSVAIAGHYVVANHYGIIAAYHLP
jgi:polyvinyl alcohol dehydrogenase (cytochrome)